MRVLTLILLFVLQLLGTDANASLMISEAPTTCASQGWQLDTDGYGVPADTSDFHFSSTTGDCVVEIAMDNLYEEYLDFGLGYANSIFTELNLSGLAAGEFAMLSFDWVFSGLDWQDDFSDAFAVSLKNGTESEALLIHDDYGSGSFSRALDSRYDGWFLDFSLMSGFNPDSFSSNLGFSNVSLVTNPVPEPGALALFLVAGLLMTHRKRLTP